MRPDETRDAAASKPGDRDMAGLRAAVDGGDPEAMHRLATALAARRDFEQAFALHKRAAIEGHSLAQISLARMLLQGTGCLTDPRTAVYWLRRAEAAGQAEASYYLALVSLGGVAMPRDGRINERVLTAVQGDYPLALRAAAIHFGRKRHEVDQSSCVRLLDRAASYGDIVAAQLLAERLARGEGCEVQPEAARRIRRRLVELGIAALPDIAIAANGKEPADAHSKPPLPGTIALEDNLHAAPAKLLSSQPRVMQIDGLLSADECRLLIASARHGPKSPPSLDIDIGSEDLAVRLAELRMARSARMELGQAEPLLLSRFDPGQRYLPGESADAPADAHARSGERIRTIHVFLNVVAGGGGIVFDASGPIAAAVGRAVIVDGIEPDGTAPQGAAAGKERKWLATLRFRHRRYRDA